MILYLSKPFISFFFDLLNYSVLISIFFILFKKKIIDAKDLFLYSLFSFSPFLINDVLIPNHVFWDQNRYVILANEIRSNWLLGNFLPPTSDTFKVAFSSWLYTFFPIISFHTINSVAFANKLIYCLTLIYINNKIKINNLLKIILLFTPTIILYSSLSLRDILILALMLLSFFLIVNEKKYFFGLITLLILCIIKTQNGVICLFSIVTFLIFDKFLRKKITLTLFLLIILSLTIFYFYDQFIFEKINYYRRGFYLEEYLDYKDLLSTEYYNSFFSIGYNFYTLKILFLGTLNFLVAPLFSIENFFHLVSATESLFLIIVYILFFYHQFLIDKKITIFWLCLFFGFIILYALIPFNENTMVRYRFPISIFFLMSSFLTTKFK